MIHWDEYKQSHTYLKNFLSAGCDSSVSINNTYFTGSSSSLTSPCRVSVCRASEDICQFRLDFDELGKGPFNSHV